jgi:stearoyl-CoA desaturase (delta-9 desaturase)
MTPPGSASNDPRSIETKPNATGTKPPLLVDNAGIVHPVTRQRGAQHDHIHSEEAAGQGEGGVATLEAPPGEDLEAIAKCVREQTNMPEDGAGNEVSYDELFEDPPLGPMSLTKKVATFMLVVIPFIGLAAGIYLSLNYPMSWFHLSVMTVMYLATGLGITIGYHRLFTHKSFKAGPIVTYLLAGFGSMAFQGPVIEWCAVHRRHHQHSDDEHDPHSPHQHGDSGIKGILKGFYHAHIGWLVSPSFGPLRPYVPDLLKDKVVAKVNSQYVYWVIAGFVFPTVLGGLVTQSWMGALMGLIWGGFVRLAVVHHITWSVNSVCHIWGTRTYKSHDHSTNNPIVGILAFGEGWHNNHHAFPASARHGLAWWQFDTSYIIIKCMEKLGLVSDVKVPSKERMKSKLRNKVA